MHAYANRFAAVLFTLAVVVTLALAGAAGAASSAPGAVYAITNSPAGNEVVVWDRAADGSLTPAGSFPTGGAGTGAGLGSQGAVVVSDDHRFLFAVNAGSDSISSFRVGPDGLGLADTASSGGSMPTSIAYHHGLLYVLNAGSPNNVSGFRVDAQGELTPIAGSARALSAAQTAPGQVDFSPDGRTLVVVERATNRIDTFAVGKDGLLGPIAVNESGGPVPFGFDWGHQGTLVVSDAGAGGGASSYRVADGALTTVTSVVMTGQRAACWTETTKNGKYAYVTNAGTGNISGLAIAQDGSISLLDADGVTGVTGGNPTDMASSNDSRFLYARVAATNRIAAFRIESDGSLSPLDGIATAGPLAGLAGF